MCPDIVHKLVVCMPPLSSVCLSENYTTCCCPAVVLSFCTLLLSEGYRPPLLSVGCHLRWCLVSFTTTVDTARRTSNDKNHHPNYRTGNRSYAETGSTSATDIPKWTAEVLSFTTMVSVIDALTVRIAHPVAGRTIIAINGYCNNENCQ